MNEALKADLRQKVKARIAVVAGRDEASLEPGQHLMADLGIDSPKALQLLMDIEEELAIEIPDEDAAGFSRVGDLVDYVVARATV